MMSGNHPMNLTVYIRMTERVAVMCFCDRTAALFSCLQQICPAKCHLVMLFVIQLAWSITLWADHVHYVVRVLITTVFLYI